MTKDEALTMALEALENIHNWLPTIGQKGLRDYEADAITAIKEALAQEQKPQVCCGEYDTCLESCTPRGRHLAQPEREWVGLTDEDISSVLSNLQVMYNRPPTTDSRAVFAQAIEAKLKEKNT